MYNFSLSSSQKSLCRSSLRHGILCGDCRQKNGTLISLGRLDCHNATLHNFRHTPKKATTTSTWMLCFKNIIMIFILLSEFFVDKHKRKQKGIFAQNWQGLKMCYVRCKWSREVESCKKQTTVYRRRVRHSHFNFSQMMMMVMILGQMSFIPTPPSPHPIPTSIFAHLENFFLPTWRL